MLICLITSLQTKTDGNLRLRRRYGGSLTTQVHNGPNGVNGQRAVQQPSVTRRRSLGGAYLCFPVPMFPGTDVPRTYVPRCCMTRMLPGGVRFPEKPGWCRDEQVCHGMTIRQTTTNHRKRPQTTANHHKSPPEFGMIGSENSGKQAITNHRKPPPELGTNTSSLAPSK